MPAEDTVKFAAPGRKQPHAAPEASPAEPIPPNTGAVREPGPPALASMPTRVLGTSPAVGMVAQAARTMVSWVPGYEVEHEIARGGMGMVLAARDPKLGRDVAIKMLLPGRRSGDAARRFVQESKITARLPHPGIPPVYELGSLPDGTPFLAMKLVCGRTLAAELRHADRTAELPRLVQIFEQVAQAVGFAHSQHVIHRDLKPANVMVGAFGEVQVMDWGIAKEVGEPDSGTWAVEPAAEQVPAGRWGGDDPVRTEAGIALGTPAYMAPEQARGELIGPHADVFALGGVLCDILTGHPPFEGDTVHDTILQAAMGDVTSAFVRLDSCAADAELVSLCKQLLSPRAADRPADGKAVADAVAAYRAGVERRLRDAETKRVAAEARTAEQRKKRRVQMAMAALLVAFVGVVGLGAWWQDRQAAERRLDEERQQQAERERVVRNSAALDNLLTQCEDRLRKGDADRAEELLSLAEEQFAEGVADNANERLALLRSELALLKQLNYIHDLKWGVIKGEFTKKERLIAAWSEVLRPLGFAAGSPPSNETVNRIRNAIIREQLLGTLEGWFWIEPSSEVLALLQSADPDGYRNDLRRARHDENAARLHELAGKPEILRQPARFALLFAREPWLLPTRRDEILQALYLRQPNDFHVLMDLAAVRPDEKLERTTERVGWYRAAIAVQPRNVSAWNNLGNALHTLGQLSAAITAYREAIRLDPKFAVTYSNLGNALRDSKDSPGALAAFKEAVRLDPNYALGRNNLANTLQDARDLPGAIAAFKEAIRLKPDFARAYSNLASALFESGDLKGALAACNEAIRLDPTDAPSHANLGSALRESGDLKGALVAYKDAIRLDPSYAPRHFNLGNTLRDLGDLQSAVAAYREAIRLDPKYAPAHSDLGNTLREVGELPAATAACREAIRLDPKQAIAHHHLGLALKAAGNLPGALAAYREAIRLDPKFARAHNSLGLALRASGDWAGATAAYREAIRTDPKYVPAYNNLGIVLKVSGDLPGAIGAYKEAIRLDPKDVLANYNLGIALTATGEIPGAIAAYRQAIRNSPNLLLAHANLATILQASGDLPGAIGEYREVIRLSPRHAGTHAALGLALTESGDAGAGRAAFAEAVRLDPNQFGPLFRDRFPFPVAPPPREVKPPGPARDPHSPPRDTDRSGRLRGAVRAVTVIAQPSLQSGHSDPSLPVVRECRIDSDPLPIRFADAGVFLADPLRQVEVVLLAEDVLCAAHDLHRVVMLDLF